MFKVWSWCVFSKETKYHEDFKNGRKIEEMSFRFSGNCVWSRCGNFSQLWGEYMLSAVNLFSWFIYTLFNVDLHITLQ